SLAPGGVHRGQVAVIDLIRPAPGLPAAAGQEGPRQGSQEQEGKDTFHAGSPPSPTRKVTVNRLPPPSRGATAISPPWRRTASRAMDSPRPVPPAARERALSTR